MAGFVASQVLGIAEVLPASEPALPLYIAPTDTFSILIYRSGTVPKVIAKVLCSVFYTFSIYSVTFLAVKGSGISLGAE